MYRINTYIYYTNNAQGAGQEFEKNQLIHFYTEICQKRCHYPLTVIWEPYQVIYEGNKITQNEPSSEKNKINSQNVL